MATNIPIMACAEKEALIKIFILNYRNKQNSDVRAMVLFYIFLVLVMWLKFNEKTYIESIFNKSSRLV